MKMIEGLSSFVKTKLKLVLIYLCLVTYAAKAQVQDKILCLRADFVFVIDISGSVSSQEVKNIVDAFMAEVSRYGVTPDTVRIGFVVFNDGVVFQQDLSGDVETVVKSISDIKNLNRGNGTHIAEAFLAAKTMFENSFRDRPVDIHRAVIFLSDGDPMWQNLEPNDNYDLEELKVGVPFFYKEGVGMFVGESAIIAQSIDATKREDIVAASEVAQLSNTQYNQDSNYVVIFSLDISGAENPADEEHLKNIANAKRREVTLDNIYEIKSYLGKTHQDLIAWIDSLSACN